MNRAVIRAAATRQPPMTSPLGGCHAGTLRCADARDYKSDLRPCCRGHIRRIVADTAELMQEYGVTWWADYGTLLGAVRNPLTTWADYPWLSQEGRPEGPLAPGILPHDKDADFGVLITDWQKLLRVGSALQRKGYRVTASPHGGKMKVLLSMLNQTNADFFCWMEKAGGVFARRSYIPVDAYKGREIQKGTLFPLETVQWEGLTLPAPVNPAAFCAFRYGENWMKPIPANHDGVRRA